MRLKFTVAYLGTPFAGWQSQRGGNAVQDHIERAFEVVTGARVPISGAGRTDAGVHALGQVFHADAGHPALDPAAWVRALNARLPGEIRILRCRPAPPGFHARFSAQAKIYRYRIETGPILSPLDFGRAWHATPAPDPALIEAAARLFTGRHNFAAFCAAPAASLRDPVRELRRVDVRTAGRRVVIEFEGSGFLYKMARMLTAAIVRCGQGRVSLEELSGALAHGGPRQNHVAPACGLTLVRVIY
ncbi:MAG: tRNA pseudouridine(38-40) synthase TruA [Terrimicrobiaceae bacterium]|nr:tRNA pseudouridine(38-40) synthase TruA [Terrimicrobiaceae bacterium]